MLKLLAIPAILIAGWHGVQAKEVGATPAARSYVCQLAEPSATFDHPGVCPQDGQDLIRKDLKLTIGVLVFEGVEDIDIAGPMEVFEASGYHIFTVSRDGRPVKAGSGMSIAPDYDFANAPKADVLVLPGGDVNSLVADERVVTWARQAGMQSRTVMSVCNGAFLLAKTGLLDGHSATTTAHHLSRLAREYPNVRVARDRRYVDEGRIITTGGLSSGIDGALHLVEREEGELRAEETARYMEYDWKRHGDNHFGNSARLAIPKLSILIPSDVWWERSTDRGDDEQWEISGTIRLSGNPSGFLEHIDEALIHSSWSVANKEALHHSYEIADGAKRRRLDVELAPGAQSQYRLALRIHAVQDTGLAGFGAYRDAIVVPNQRDLDCETLKTDLPMHRCPPQP